MTQVRVLMVPILAVLAWWFTADIQSDSLTLSAIIISVTAIGIMQVALVVVYRFQHKLRAVDQIWLYKTQLKLTAPVYIASGLSALIFVDLVIGLSREKTIIEPAKRVYCRQTSNVPGRPATERLLLNGRICFELTDRVGSMVYAEAQQYVAAPTVGAPVLLAISTAESLFFGANAYILRVAVKK